MACDTRGNGVSKKYALLALKNNTMQKNIITNPQNTAAAPLPNTLLEHVVSRGHLRSVAPPSFSTTKLLSLFCS